jgi:hypothetical protein
MNDRMGSRLTLAGGVAATIVGLIVRAYSVIPADFPLNDGGLFYQMAIDLRERGPFLPATTQYNGLEIPFAYPPLGFYLAAILHDALGGIDLFRWLPLTLTTLTVPAFLLLARGLLGGTVTPVAATFAFALMPRSFEWLVMGGGLTRSLGLLLAILALWFTWRMLKAPTVAGGLLAGLAGGLTVLAHPQATLFVATAALLMLLARLRTWRQARTVGLALAAAALIVAPWAVAVVSEHGLEPLIAAGQTQPGLAVGAFKLISLDFAGSRISQIVAALAFAGILLALTHGRWLLPAWFAVVLLLDSRGGATYVTVPAAMLAGQAFVALVAAPFWRDPPSARRPSQYVRHHPASAFLISIIVLVAIVDALGSQIAPNWPAATLTAEQREGMTWVADEGPEDARYLVVSGRPWPIDATAEWFPVLANARSIATVQGTEWLEPGAFYRAAEASDDLRQCARRPSECLDVWSEDWGVSFTHVFLPNGSVAGPLGDEDCCVALRAALHEDARYRVVHDGIGATIFERTDE